jgi:Nucleotidyl transferase AbiEii toxin, Type IV TA system
MTLAEPIAVTLEVTEAFERLGVRYLVGGSLASSVHGIPRATQDIDFLAELAGRHVDELVAFLQGRYYVDRDMILDAIRRRASFNVVQLRTMFKVDVFVSDRSDLVREEMDRRVPFSLGDPPRHVYVCSAEDIVVQKLDWYRKGNEVSERQWRDLIGVLEVQAGKLDLDYIRRWARELSLVDLAERALSEAGS